MLCLLSRSGQNMGSPGGNHVSPLLINTMNQRLNIKSEPVSPTREGTPSMGLRPPSQNPGQYSPGHMSPLLNASHSNCSSPVANMHGGPPPPHPQSHGQPPGSQGGPQQSNMGSDQQHGGMNGGGGGGNGMSDYDSGGPMMKRQRLEGWTT